MQSISSPLFTTFGLAPIQVTHNTDMTIDDRIYFWLFNGVKTRDKISELLASEKPQWRYFGSDRKDLKAKRISDLMILVWGSDEAKPWDSFGGIHQKIRSSAAKILKLELLLLKLSAQTALQTIYTSLSKQGKSDSEIKTLLQNDSFFKIYKQSDIDSRNSFEFGRKTALQQTVASIAKGILSGIGILGLKLALVKYVSNLLPDAEVRPEVAKNFYDLARTDWFHTIFVGPIAEEILFRDAIPQKLLAFLPSLAAQGISTCLFGALHLANGHSDVYRQALLATLAGAIDGLMANRHGMIVPIVSHITRNGIIFVARKLGF